MSFDCNLPAPFLSKVALNSEARILCNSVCYISEISEEQEGLRRKVDWKF